MADGMQKKWFHFINVKNWADYGLLTSQIFSHVGPVFMHSLMAEQNRSKLQAWAQSEQKCVLKPSKKRLCDNFYLILSEEGDEEGELEQN